MAIPPEVRADAETALKEFCAQSSSADVAESSRLEFEIAENHVVLIERRPSFLNHLEWTSVPKAKFRYSPAKGVWSLYWPDTNQRWHRLSSAKTDKDIRVLLNFDCLKGNREDRYEDWVEEKVRAVIKEHIENPTPVKYSQALKLACNAVREARKIFDSLHVYQVPAGRESLNQYS